jgi:uncharacterized protein YndB with AHSA1/START domain
MAPRPFDFDRSWDFPVSPGEFWSTITRTDDFPKWWGWLARFDSDGLAAGSGARFEVRSPLPYSLNLELEVVEVVDQQLVSTVVDGDLHGPARLEIDETDEGCRARLVWSLDPRQRLLTTLATVSRPLMVWAHDQVVQMGVAQFRRAALRESDEQH